MGVVFALFYLRFRRVMPLVVAHTLLDLVAFVGYGLFRAEVDSMLARLLEVLPG
jgi:membrane protease YdiL (CAAX protease family)